MKKKQMSDAEIRLIILLVSIIMLAGAYFLGFTRLTAAARELEALNETDEATVTQLESMVGRQAQVEQETEDMKQEVADIVAKYPSDLTTEKAINIVQNMEDYSGVHIPNIDLTMGTKLMEFDPSAIPEGPAPVGYYSTLSMTYTGTYEGIKRMVEFVNSMADRCTVPEISVTYDESEDSLSGSVTLNMYYLQNTGKEYVAPPGNGSSKGVDSIFGSNGTMTPAAGMGAENTDAGNTDAGDVVSQ